MTKKELRQLTRNLDKVEEMLRQRVLHILRNTPDKEQAAYNIAKQLPEIVRLEYASLREGILHFKKDCFEKIEKLQREQKANFERLQREVKEEGQSGEEWKRGSIEDGQ